MGETGSVSYHFTRQHTLLTRTTNANQHDLTLDGSNTVLTSAELALTIEQFIGQTFFYGVLL